MNFQLELKLENTKVMEQVKTCPNCGRGLPAQVAGRPRRFCSNKCKWALYQRERRARLASSL